jgi:nucleotide-binding universal stress UspA family protein
MTQHAFRHRGYGQADPDDDLDAPPASSVSRREVAVALVGAASPVGAVAYARAITAALNLPLHGLFAWPTPIAPRDVPRLLDLPPAALEGIVIDVEIGDPFDRVLAYSASRPGALLVVPCDEGGEPFGLCPTASRVLADTAANVLLVRGTPPPRLSRILVPLDGTPSTAAAIGPAGELARQAGASLDIVLVGEAQQKATEPGSMSPPQYLDQPHHEWSAFSEEFVERFIGGIGHCPTEVTTRFYLGAGDPANEILRFARLLHSDLIALVWHGEVSDEHGGVFRAVVRAADRPILVLRR